LHPGHFQVFSTTSISTTGGLAISVIAGYAQAALAVRRVVAAIVLNIKSIELGIRIEIKSLSAQVYVV